MNVTREEKGKNIYVSIISCKPYIIHNIKLFLKVQQYFKTINYM